MNTHFDAPRRKNWRELKSGEPQDGYDPYPIYRELHAQAPVWKSDWGQIYVAGYHNLARLFRDPNLLQWGDAGPSQDARNRAQNTLTAFFADWLLYYDPPKHTELRRRMIGLMANANSAQFAPAIRTVAKRLLDTAPAGQFCFASTIARPLPTEVICEVAAVPVSMLSQIKAWSTAFREILDLGVDDAPPELVTICADACDYVRDLSRNSEWREQAFWGKLDEICGDLPEDVIASNLLLIMFAGQETTVHLIASMAHHLASNQRIWYALRADRSLIPAAVEETLRLESPVQKLGRRNIEPIILDGVEIPEGSQIVLLIGAANRDPSVFPDPDRFDVKRSLPKHLGLGAGHHFCIGAKLAVMEAEIALAEMLDRWRNVELTGKSRFYANSAFRGPETVPIKVVPA